MTSGLSELLDVLIKMLTKSRLHSPYNGLCSITLNGNPDGCCACIGPTFCIAFFTHRDSKLYKDVTFHIISFLVYPGKLLNTLKQKWFF